MKKLLKDLPEIVIAIILIAVSRKDLSSTINIIGLWSGILFAVIIFIARIKNYLEDFKKY